MAFEGGLPMEWMLMPLRRYADFSGRSRRKEYWMFMLAVAILYAACFLVFGGLGTPASEPEGEGGLFAIPILILVLALIIPSLAVQVRRFHDQDKSGWFVLIGLIPFVGGFVVLVFMCLEGTRGPNRFGPDPLDPTSAKVFT